ncbi:MAG TPA: hypothetical protein ENJ65_05415, partial [Candidatus Tenderia electrophaga]|nr:hypothetical protein [Candidatus Tenderia electrophaga]
PACDALLRWAGLAKPVTVDYHARREADIERLADMLEQHLDMAELDDWLGLDSAAKAASA